MRRALCSPRNEFHRKHWSPWQRTVRPRWRHLARDSGIYNSTFRELSFVRTLAGKISVERRLRTTGRTWERNEKKKKMIAQVRGSRLGVQFKNVGRPKLTASFFFGRAWHPQSWKKRLPHWAKRQWRGEFSLEKERVASFFFRTGDKVQSLQVCVLSVPEKKKEGKKRLA